MEVEAKYSIPDYDTLVRLRTAVRLGPYVLGEGKSSQVLDRYLDTATRALRGQGYSCRVRHKDGEWIMTVKGLETAESALHQRFESEVVLAREPGRSAADPTEWPAWDGRELVSSLIGSELLDDLFSVEQTRFTRELRQEKRLVAELSIDEGQAVAGGKRRGFRTLEAELVGEGVRADLEALEEHLVRTWGLAPELQSKYELGLALLSDEPSQSDQESRLSAEERSLLTGLAAREQDPQLQAWARLLLGWAEGLSIRRAGTQAGLSRSWAYELLGRFRSQRMAMFAVELPPSVDLESASVAVAPSPSGVQLGENGKAAPTEASDSEVVHRQQRRLTMAELCERFEIDRPHARWVASQAMALFGATAPVHKLAADRGRLLEAMCILHELGGESVADRHRAAGTDVVLQHPIVELTDVEQQMVAAAIWLHRKPAKRKRLEAPVVSTLPSEVQKDALALTALLRVADGLDYMRSQSTTLGLIQVNPEAIEAPTRGPFAGIDAVRAQSRADLWDRLFGVPMRFTANLGETAEAASQPGGESLGGQDAHSPLHPLVPGIVPDDTLAEAGRKVLHVHLLRMLSCEPATRAGQETEALHDMRVATRRMRAALRVFGSHLSPRVIRPYADGLRATAQVLGAVRDQDVLLAKAQAYLSALPPQQAHDLDPLLSAWRELRSQARDEMLAYLDSDKYQDFARSFLLFLRSPGAGVRESRGSMPEPVLVRHLAPRLIYARWARVLAFGPHIDRAPTALLHALRIECKRLRYCLEFLTEVLGRDAQVVVAEVVRLQDHLGELHDADVANGLLSTFLFSPGADKPASPVIAPGVVSYLAAQQRELQTLMQTFPAKWAEFTRPEVRRWLANAVAGL